jgi:hypothetical protein
MTENGPCISGTLGLLNSLGGVYEGDFCQCRLLGLARFAAGAPRRTRGTLFQGGLEYLPHQALLTSPDEQQADLQRRLKFERVVAPEVRDLFHQLRIAGNRRAKVFR